MDAALVLIDQDAMARARAARCLAESGRVSGFETAQAFFSSVTSPGPHCLIVSARLEDMTCAQVQAEAHQRGLRVPTLFLVMPAQIELAISLLKGGATDVLVEPVEPDELRRRVDAVLVTGERALAQAKATRERLGKLTQRELEVVLLATSGLSNKDIADHLCISFRTVEVHRRNAMRKTGTGNIVELTHLVGSAWHEDQNVTDGGHRPDALTQREREVLQLGHEGLTNKVIATRLSISARTVETHRGNASRKVDSVTASASEDPSSPQLSLWGTGKRLRAVGDS